MVIIGITQVLRTLESSLYWLGSRVIRKIFYFCISDFVICLSCYLIKIYLYSFNTLRTLDMIEMLLEWITYTVRELGISSKIFLWFNIMPWFCYVV